MTDMTEEEAIQEALRQRKKYWSYHYCSLVMLLAAAHLAMIDGGRGHIGWLVFDLALMAIAVGWFYHSRWWAQAYNLALEGTGYEHG